MLLIIYLPSLVMRACQGCRKRKIKCDSATTNIWPCAACTRLKLVCAPPSTTDQDYESTTFEQSPESERQIVPPNNNNNNEHIVSTAAPQFGGGSSLLPHAPAFQPSVTHPNSFETTGGYIPPTKQYFSQPHRDPSDPVQPLYLPNSSEFCGSLEAPFRSADVRQPTTLSYLPVPHAPPFPAVAQPVQPVAQPSEQPIGTSLTDAFGELKIDETGIGMLLASHAIYISLYINSTLLTPISSACFDSASNFAFLSSPLSQTAETE